MTLVQVEKPFWSINKLSNKLIKFSIMGYTGWTGKKKISKILLKGESLMIMYFSLCGFIVIFLC